jgi:serpin B
MNVMMQRLVIPVTVVLAVSACATPDSANPEGIEVLQSDAAFAPGDVTREDQRLLAEGDTAFALDLLRLAADGGNVFVSPMSITTALGMLEVGARGETLAEIQDVLWEAAPMHAARGALGARLQQGEALPPEVEADPFVVHSVNSLWLQQGYPVLQPFLDSLAIHYGAALFLVDYLADTDGTRVTINDWVADRTDDRIEDLIPPGVLNAATRLVLTNAVYFKSSWMIPFDPTDTSDGAFTFTDGTQNSVPMMRASDTFRYLAGEGFQAVWLPYWGGTSMMAILPEASPQELLEVLEGRQLLDGRLDAVMRSFEEISLPRFGFEFELRLNQLLEDLGMRSAFRPPPGPGTADFTGITAGPELFVTDVLHKAFVTVDEEGTEAAAATAAVLAGFSAPLDPPLTLRFDRPFLFLIQDDATGAPIFAGVVENPTA